VLLTGVLRSKSNQVNNAIMKQLNLICGLVCRNIRPRDYAEEVKKASVPLQPAGDSHPLAIAASNAASLKASKSPEMFDPLRSDQQHSDPLRALSGGENYTGISSFPTIPSLAAAAASPSPVAAPRVASNPDEVDFVPWKVRAPSILQKYTTNASIPVPVRFV
jgi:hypothetical protein